ncbi:MAG: HAMP domain-containing histidine kinase [Actinobacteria bacterium]|nr:HAMP domain-containing histidine kinase [Actinomycetota bacterium]
MSDARLAEMIVKAAHEIRAPLTSVKGFSSTLLTRWDRFTDEQRFEFVSTIHAGAERMVRVISEVVDLARIESNSLELHKIEVALGGLVEKAIEQVAPLQGSDRIQSAIPERLKIKADPERLLQVIFNLVENAVKFSEEGPVKVTGEVVEEGVEVAVSDEGIGIPADLIADIFSGPGPLSGVATPLGSGLGLYLSKRIVELHGGQLTVRSTEGSGSVFQLRLPQEGDDG